MLNEQLIRFTLADMNTVYFVSRVLSKCNFRSGCTYTESNRKRTETSINSLKDEVGIITTTIHPYTCFLSRWGAE